MMPRCGRPSQFTQSATWSGFRWRSAELPSARRHKLSLSRDMLDASQQPGAAGPRAGLKVATPKRCVHSFRSRWVSHGSAASMNHPESVRTWRSVSENHHAKSACYGGAMLLALSRHSDVTGGAARTAPTQAEARRLSRGASQPAAHRRHTRRSRHPIDNTSMVVRASWEQMPRAMPRNKDLNARSSSSVRRLRRVANYRESAQ